MGPGGNNTPSETGSTNPAHNGGGSGDANPPSGNGGNGGGGHNPTGVGDALPGVLKKDYTLVQIGGIVYAVYYVDLGGKKIKMAWRIKKEDFEAFDIDLTKVPKISQAAFNQVETMGNATEIARGDMEDIHPFEQYLKELRRTYGNVSWLHDKEFMKVFLEGWSENWSESELQQRLKRTKWYNSRTDQQRTWEMETGKADRKVQVKAVRTQMAQQLEALLGPTMGLDALKLNEGELAKAAQNIASGKFGSVNDGLAIWLDKMRKKLEGIEGSQAWIDKQLAIEDQRAFVNRPEETREQLRQDAMRWLGPGGMPDNSTLTTWAKNITSGLASEEDWQKFLRKQSKALYPWLGPDEAWQDRASSYKRIAEDTLGKPVGWNDKMLQNLGGSDASGGATGQALSYDEFERQLRTTDAFWAGSTARKEGWDLLSYMNQTFTGEAA